MTESDTEVITCPACGHLLRVPLDLLGVQVQCPECRAMFRAPVRDERGSLGNAELLSRPVPAAGRKPPDVMLLLPAFGLLFCGFASVIVNVVLTYLFITDVAGSEQYIRNQMPTLRQAGLGKDDPPEDRERLDDERARSTTRILQWALPMFVVVSAATFLGGVSMALRWNYRIAQVGCVAAAINLPHLCCVPGSVAGFWGLLMLWSDEGRAHFERTTSQ